MSGLKRKIRTPKRLKQRLVLGCSCHPHFMPFCAFIKVKDGATTLGGGYNQVGKEGEPALWSSWVPLGINGQLSLWRWPQGRCVWVVWCSPSHGLEKEWIKSCFQREKTGLFAKCLWKDLVSCYYWGYNLNGQHWKRSNWQMSGSFPDGNFPLLSLWWSLQELPPLN